MWLRWFFLVEKAIIISLFALEGQLNLKFFIESLLLLNFKIETIEFAIVSVYFTFAIKSVFNISEILQIALELVEIVYFTSTHIKLNNSLAHQHWQKARERELQFSIQRSKQKWHWHSNRTENSILMIRQFPVKSTSSWFWINFFLTASISE